MARDLMDDTYYTATRGAKIPIKWTAPEVCRNNETFRGAEAFLK